MAIETITLPFIWLLNGTLTLAYLIFKHITAMLMIAPLFWLNMTTENAQRPWMVAAGLLALSAAIFAPPVVGIWLLVMAVASVVAVRLEKFNPDTLRWRIAGGLAAYALIGLGVMAYKTLAPVMIDEDSLFSQGQAYLSTIIGIATILAPLSFLGILVQAVWTHPPVDGTPQVIFHRVRTRGRRD